jgi:hypothetical protein
MVTSLKILTAETHLSDGQFLLEENILNKENSARYGAETQDQPFRKEKNRF